MTNTLTLTKSAQLDIVINSSIKEAFITACEKLDITAIEKVLTEDDLFENKNKWEFLAKYKARFDKIKHEKGITKLISGDAKCGNCYLGKNVVSFTDTDNKIYFGFLFREEDGVIVDIWECNWFDGFFRSAIPSQNKPHLK